MTLWKWNRCKPTLRFVDVLEKPNPHCRLSNRVTLLGKFQMHIWILPIWVHLNMTFCYFLKTITLYLSPVSCHRTVIIWKVVIFRILLLLPFCNNFVLIMLKRRKSKLIFFYQHTLQKGHISAPYRPNIKRIKAVFVCGLNVSSWKQTLHISNIYHNER